MRLKFDLDPTVPRVVIIAVLLFVEALAIPAYSILMTNQMPTEVQWFAFIFGALLQVVTYLLGFMGMQRDEK